MGSKPGCLDTSVQVTYAPMYEVKLCHAHSVSVSIGGGPSLGGIAQGGTNILRVGLSLGEDFK